MSCSTIVSRFLFRTFRFQPYTGNVPASFRLASGTHSSVPWTSRAQFTPAVTAEPSLAALKQPLFASFLRPIGCLELGTILPSQSLESLPIRISSKKSLDLTKVLLQRRCALPVLLR